MSHRIFGSLMEAVHATATGSRLPMKALAAELDYSPTALSHRTSLGGFSKKPFPANDLHGRLIKIQLVTGDHSILWTMCDLLGYEPPRAKPDTLPERVTKLTAAAEGLQRDIRQLVIDFKDYGTDKRRAGR